MNNKYSGRSYGRLISYYENIIIAHNNEFCVWHESQKETQKAQEDECLWKGLEEMNLSLYPASNNATEQKYAFGLTTGTAAMLNVGF